MTQLGEGVQIGVVDATDVSGDEASVKFDEAFQFVDWAGEAIGNVRYEILKSDGTRDSGVADGEGKIPRLKDPKPLLVRVRFLGIVRSA